MITYKSRVHAGVMFFRKSSGLLKMYDDCMRLLESFDSLTFHSFPNSVDECILGLAMPLNNMKATIEKPEMIAAFPCLTKVKANIYIPELEYATPWHNYIRGGILLHWGTRQTKQVLYNFNIDGLLYIKKHGHNLLGRLLFQCKIKFYYNKIKYLIKKL